MTVPCCGSTWTGHCGCVGQLSCRTNGEIYTDLGPDYYVRRDPEQARRRAVRQLKSLGYEVSLSPASA